MSSRINLSELVGKTVKDENEREIGRIVSFLMDELGKAKDVLVDNNYGNLARFSLDKLLMDDNGIALVSDRSKKLQSLSEQLPIIRKKRKILDKLSANKVIPPEIYENLCKEFDKNLDDMMGEAQILQKNIDKKVKVQEGRVKGLQLARAFLEIEHGIGTINDEVYKQSIMSLLKEVKSSQQAKLRMLKFKDKVQNIIVEEEETQKDPTLELSTKPNLLVSLPETESKTEPDTDTEEEGQAIPVRVTE